MSEPSEYFRNTLDTIGCIFLENARFKLDSIDNPLGETPRDISGSVYPQLSQIKDYKDSSNLTPFLNCIAFSITTDKKVIFKYQLFPEDIEEIPVSSRVPEQSIGVYIRSLDNFNRLTPQYGFVDFFTYGSSSKTRNYNEQTDTLDEDTKKNLYDGCWFIMQWDEWRSPAVMYLVEGQYCGSNVNRGILTNTDYSFSSNYTANRAIFKPRRVEKDRFELYCTTQTNYANVWYYILRRLLYLDRYLNVLKQYNQIDAFNDIPVSEKLVFYPQRTEAPYKKYSGNQIFEPHQLDWKTSNKVLNINNLRVKTDCNVCMATTDCLTCNDCTYNGTAGASENLGNGFIIQPSWMYIMSQLMKNNKYNVQKNFCVTYVKNRSEFYLRPTDTYRLTNEYLDNYFTTEGQFCETIETNFCKQINPTTTKSNLYTSECKDICKRYNCRDIVTSFCRSLEDQALSSDNRGICGCMVDATFVKDSYDKYVDFMDRRRIDFSNCKEPEYIFPPCKTANYTAVGGLTTNPLRTDCKFPAVNCVSYIEIENNGNIGNINTDVTQDCKSFINEISAGTQDCKFDVDCNVVPNFPYCINNKCQQCKTNNDCKNAGTPLCDLSLNVCRECLTSEDCKDSNKPICSNNKCTECILDSDCLDGKLCNSSGKCVFECIADTNCLKDQVCINNKCVPKSSNNTAIYLGIGTGILVFIIIVVWLLRRRKR